MASTSNRLTIWIRNIGLLIVAATFVLFFGLGDPFATSGTGPVAEVRGEPIDREVFEFFREQNQRQFQQLSQSGMDRETLRNLLDSQTRESLVRRYLLAQEAERLGIGVTDPELATDLRTNPAFQVGGRFDRELVERIIAQTQLGERDWAREYRRDIALRKFRRLVESPVRVSTATAREQLLRQRTTLKLRFARANAEELRADVTLSDAEVDAFLDSQGERIQAAYDTRRAEFEQPERVRASHILLTGDDAMARAIVVHDELEAGVDFAELARTRSDDAATREDGGSLGTFPRGRFPQAFDDAAFGLEPGATSGPVETPRGVHLIRVDEKLPAETTPIDEARRRIARELLVEERAEAAARQAIEQILAEVAAGKSFTAAADEVGVPVEETEPFPAQAPAVPGLAGVPGLIEAAVLLREDEPVANEVFAGGESFYAISLLTRSQPDEAAIEAELEDLRQRLSDLERQQTAALWFRERRDEARESGDVREFALYPQ